MHLLGQLQLWKALFWGEMWCCHGMVWFPVTLPETCSLSAPSASWACPEGGLTMSQDCCELCQPLAWRTVASLVTFWQMSALCASHPSSSKAGLTCASICPPLQPVVHTPRMIFVLDTASLWVLPEMWTREKLTSRLAQPRVRRGCTKHWHWRYLTSPRSCPYLLLLAYRSATQGDAPEVIALQEVAEN